MFELIQSRKPRKLNLLKYSITDNKEPMPKSCFIDKNRVDTVKLATEKRDKNG